MDDDDLLRAAGALRPDFEAVDWASTPLGPMAGWSPALRHTARLALLTRFPVTLLWGPEHVMVYNAAYVPILAAKHPAALGRPVREIFPEVWDDIRPLLEQVLEGRGATWIADGALPLERDGFLGESHHTFSYSPVAGDDGRIEGVLDITMETTQHVQTARRLTVLGALRDRLGDALRTREVTRRALEVLGADHADFAAVEIVAAPTDDIDDLVLEETPHGRIALLPVGGRRTGVPPRVLRVRLGALLAPDDDYLDFLRLAAASISQALDRVAALQEGRRMSETLQRSLLTRPPQLQGLRIAARYQPASEQAQIGGDWHDAFVLPGGQLTAVIGDVTGHDRHAAAAMAQIRNLLRGVASTLVEPPGRVLSGLEEAMETLGVGIQATAILAQLDPDGAAGVPAGHRRICWSNAGHPPPVVVDRVGRVEALERVPDPLLGIGTRERHHHEFVLAPGSTILFYTDGLVERRGVPWETSLAWLTGELTRPFASPDELCDHLIAALAGSVDDDVALLALRVADAS